MINPLFEVKELLKLDGLKEDEIEVQIEDKANIIKVPRLDPETYNVLNSYGYFITQAFDKLGNAKEYYIHIRIK